MNRLKITVNGACGRMGVQVAGIIESHPMFELTGLWEYDGHPDIARGRCISACSVTRQWEGTAAESIIDFSTDAGLAGLLDRLVESGASLVSGTTGLSGETIARLRKTARFAPVFYAANMSTGIYVMNRLAELAARLVGPDWDVELVEMHHNRKADAPSGTAAALVKTVQDAWPRPLEPVYGRVGIRGPREGGELGVFSLRGGDVVGEHELIFAGEAETLKLKHVATSRALFAAGALKAAKWLAGRGPGFYTMDDMFGHARTTPPEA